MLIIPLRITASKIMWIFLIELLLIMLRLSIISLLPRGLRLWKVRGLRWGRWIGRKMVGISGLEIKMIIFPSRIIPAVRRRESNNLLWFYLLPHHHPIHQVSYPSLNLNLKFNKFKGSLNLLSTPAEILSSTNCLGILWSVSTSKDNQRHTQGQIFSRRNTNQLWNQQQTQPKNMNLKFNKFKGSLNLLSTPAEILSSTNCLGILWSVSTSKDNQRHTQGQIFSRRNMNQL